MRIFKCLTGAIILVAASFHVNAQDDMEAKHKMWVEANLETKKDAIDFIRTTYKDYTVLIGKHALETGIYNREIKFNNCELIIETEGRELESSWRSVRDFTKDVVVIDLDKVILDGNDIKPNGPENAKGLFRGNGHGHYHNIPSYSILTAAPNRDNDKFMNQHCEQHLQWAYQFLIEKCSGKK